MVLVPELDGSGNPILDGAGNPVLVDDASAPPPSITLAGTSDRSHSAGDYAQSFLELMPSGPVWPRDPDAVLAKIAAGLAPSYARSDERAQELLEESPAAGGLNELLPEWEAALGLPDPCIGQLATIQERRNVVAGKLAARGGQSVPYFLRLAQTVGRPLNGINEYAPARAGGLRAGQPCNGVDWAYSWQASLEQQSLLEFRAGQSTAGEPLRSWGSLAIECILRRYSPAHTILTFAYTPTGP